MMGVQDFRPPMMGVQDFRLEAEKGGYIFTQSPFPLLLMGAFSQGSNNLSWSVPF
jgi:hypothetical protein